MINLDKVIDCNKYRAEPGKKIQLKDFATGYDGDEVVKNEAKDLLEDSIKKLTEIQEKFYAHNHYSVLIIFQAMDAAGKDSTIKHILSGFNPQGVKVVSFKVPSAEELDHHYLWRHYKVLPPRGERCIFNRSHYENVLVTRVHPEYVLNEHIPGIDSVSKIDETFWHSRYEQINRFEKNLTENGTVILKFFLHVSKKEQKERFLERIDRPEKNWKFSMGDLKERALWNQYQHAYEEAISATSKEHAPWFIIPADNKWFTRLAISNLIEKQFEKLNIHYPVLTDAHREELKQARSQLMSEQW